ncbi:MAG: glycosyltransferase [Verrucomicrobiota bacterium]
MKDLAVLITIYNDEEGLHTALESIREEDNRFTVVIVDGASTEPPTLRKEHYPFEVILIRQEERSGIVGGLNEGLAYIREKGFRFVARLDAGDRQIPDRLEIQYQKLKNSDRLAMIGSNANYFSEETGDKIFVTDLPLNSAGIRKWSVFQTCFIHPTVMIDLSRIDDSLCYESRHLHIEDYVLFTKIAERYETENIPQPLLDCLVRESGISLSNDRAQLLSGIRHHLENPKLLTPLWYAYVLKRITYLILPYRLRVSIKKLFGFVRNPARMPNPSDQQLESLNSGNRHVRLKRLPARSTSPKHNRSQFLTQ